MAQGAVEAYSVVVTALRRSLSHPKFSIYTTRKIPIVPKKFTFVVIAISTNRDLATTAADAFRGDAVISMLPNDQALREVFIEGDLLVPAPRQKAPQISPIFKADTVRLHVSREKEKDWDDTKVVQPDGCGQARRGGEGWTLPPGSGER
jgi:hypothetical protein